LERQRLVPSGKSSKISIPATPPAYQDKYSWKTEITGKLCDMHDVRINSSRTVDVACLPAPSAIERDASTGSATKKVEKPKTEETSKATGSGSSGKKWTIYFKNATKGSEAFDLEIDYQDINDSKALAYTTVNLTAGASKTVQFIPKDGQVRFGLMVSVKGAGTCLIQKLPLDLRADGAGLAFHVERDIPKNIRADAFSCYFDKN
jgi:hypothetical protein